MMDGSNMNGGMGSAGTKNMCRCPHHKMVPLMAFLIGVAFLLRNLGILTMGAVDLVWPIFLIVGAGTKLNENKCKCC